MERSVLIRGTFPVLGAERLSGGLAVDAGFQASLDGIPLRSVAWMGEGVLSAIVPAGLPLGPHELTVRGPYGLSGTLDRAWTSSTLAPASLSGATAFSLSQASVGQTVVLQLIATNTGDTDALSVVPALTLSGTAMAIVVSTPVAQDVPGHSTRSFVWALRLTGSGDLAASLVAAGDDALTGLAVATPPSTASVHAQKAAALAGSLQAPPLIELNQTVPVTLTATNLGEASANGVAAALAGAPAGALTTASGPSPASATLAGGGQQAFNWSVKGTTLGPASLSATATGQDANSGASASVIASAATRVGTPPALVLTLRASQDPVDVGQTFSLMIDATNSGEVPARSVTLSAIALSGTGSVNLVSPTGPMSADIAGGATVTFSATFTGAAAGSVSFSVSASGTDALTSAAVSSSPASGTLTVQTPAALALSATLTSASGAAVAQVDVGQQVVFTLNVSNTGQAAAQKVVPTGPTFSLASPPLQLLSGPSPSTTNLKGGTSASFVWTYAATAPTSGASSAAVTISSGASAQDINSGAAVTAAPVSVPLTVQTPASFFLAASLPAQVAVNSSFTLSLTVKNTGGATATGVTAAAAVAATSTGKAALTAGPTPAGPVSLAGGASQVFTWTYSATGAGSFNLALSATGTDVNRAQLVSASASASTSIVEALLVGPAVPFPGTQSTTFSYALSYGAQLWLGPSGDGSGAVRSAGDGSGAQTVAWQLEADTVPAYASRNVSYQPPNPPGDPTIGYTGCPTGPGNANPACGPDNEQGRALFFSFFTPSSVPGPFSGTEWLVLSGGRDNGGAKSVYMSTAAFPLAAGGRTDFAYVNLGGGTPNPSGYLSGSTTSATSGHGFHGRLYLGFGDSGTTGPNATSPELIAILKPPALPGLNATLGSDFVNLNANYLPGIGTNATTVTNPLAGSNTPVLLDTISEFNDALYLGNNGGIVRSNNNNPAPCTAPGVCTDWTLITPAATPSALLYTNHTSVATTKLFNYEPADKAVPAIVASGGKLYFARNVYNPSTGARGAQLWSCTPNLSAPQCGAADWTLVAGNSAPMDAGLTQFQDANNTAITLLAAVTAPTIPPVNYLYVGFNNANGIVLYRTAKAALQSDFSGAGGCPAPCTGIGGQGFGAGLTHIYDAQALTFAGATSLFVSAGTGASSVSVYRINP